MIDIKAIKAAAEAAESRNWTHGANPATVIALCDEIERLREVLQHMLSSDGISSGERGLINQVLNGDKQ